MNNIAANNTVLKSILGGLTALTIAAGSVSAHAESLPEPGGLDLSNLNTLMAQIAWQGRTEPMTSLERLNLNYSNGWQSEQGLDDPMVTRSNLLNSPAARYFVRQFSDSHGR